MFHIQHHLFLRRSHLNIFVRSWYSFKEIDVCIRTYEVLMKPKSKSVRTNSDSEQHYVVF
jgi:hypothetical protein